MSDIDIIKMMRDTGIVNDLVSVSRERVYNPEFVNQVNKLEFTSIKQKEVLQGLTMAHLSGLRFHFVPRFILKHIDEKDKVQDKFDSIEALITQDLQYEFVKQTKPIDISEKDYWKFFNLVLMPIANDIDQGMQNPSLIWGESEHGDLNIGGIIGVVLKRVFEKQSTADIFSGTQVNLFDFVPVVYLIDNWFIAGMKACSEVLS